MDSSRRLFIPSLVAFVLATALPVFGQAGADKNSNLLSNPDFTKGVEGWEFDAHHKRGQVAPDPAEKRAGKPSVRIDNAGPDDSTLGQKVTVKPATRYRLTGWVKTKNVGSADSTTAAGANLSVRPGFLKSESLTKNQGWKKLTLEITTVGETELLVGPRLGAFSAFVSGTAWFADLELKELGPAKK